MTAAGGRDLDVSRLPTVVFGHRGLLWWGTLGFVAIEGTTLVICAVVYLYLGRHVPAWPPPGTPRPDLVVPTVQAALMLASLAPAAALDRAARRLDLGAVRRLMVWLSLLSVAFAALRWFEFGALNVRWDASAYGSAAWLVLAGHGTLVGAEVLEVLPFSYVLFRGPLEERYFSDANDLSLYWYFMVGVWLPLYALVFLSPNLR